MQIGFNLTGSSGTKGFCNTTIPKKLLKGPWTYTTYDAVEVEIREVENQTHSFINFTYTHEGTMHITIQGTSVIPEFPSTTILLTFVTLPLIVIAVAKTKKTSKIPLFNKSNEHTSKAGGFSRVGTLII